MSKLVEVVTEKVKQDLKVSNRLYNVVETGVNIMEQRACSAYEGDCCLLLFKDSINLSGRLVMHEGFVVEMYTVKDWVHDSNKNNEIAVNMFLNSSRTVQGH